MNTSINPDTPPPPPPKPGSHEASRGGTPQNMSSMPTPQPPQPMRPDTQTNFQHASYTPTSLPAPPAVEEGWLPELVKEKWYAYTRPTPARCLLTSSSQHGGPPIYPERPIPHFCPVKSAPITYSPTTKPRILNSSKQRPCHTPTRYAKTSRRTPQLDRDNAIAASITRSHLAQETI